MTVAGTDEKFDARLLIERALQRVHAFHGDPAARMLLGGADAAGTESGLRSAGEVLRCRDGSIAVTDPARAAELLADARFTTVVPADPAQYTLACVDEVLRDELDTQLPGEFAEQSDVDERVEVALSGPAQMLDLVADVIRPIVNAVFADALRIATARRAEFEYWAADAGMALDATICPPRLPDAHDLAAALHGLNELGGRTARAAAALTCELAVNRTTDLIRGLLDDPDGESSAGPPLRVHRVFPRQETELGEQRVEPPTRVLVVCGPDEWSAAHPRQAAAVRIVADRLGTALRGRLGRFRVAGEPVRRRRAPATRAVVGLPVTVAAAGGC